MPAAAAVAIAAAIARYATCRRLLIIASIDVATPPLERCFFRRLIMPLLRAEPLRYVRSFRFSSFYFAMSCYVFMRRYAIIAAFHDAFAASIFLMPLIFADDYFHFSRHAGAFLYAFYAAISCAAYADFAYAAPRRR